MNYELKHLSFLVHRVMRGDGLSNEDYIFLTDLRGLLRKADEQMRFIDEAMDMSMLNI